MGFAQYLINVLNRNQVFESTTAAKDVTDTAVSQISGKVGGDISDSITLKTSFEALEQAFDSIPLEHFETPEDPGLEEVFGLLIKKDKIDFFEKYTKKEESAAKGLIDSIASIDVDRDQAKYVNYITLYGRVAERLQKIYKLVTGNMDEPVVSEAVDIDDEVKPKLKSIVDSASRGIGLFKNVISKEEKRIDDVPETDEGSERLERMKDFLDLLGLGSSLEDKLKKKSQKMPKESNDEVTISLKNKKRIIERLISGIKVAGLPILTDGKIKENGDYFRMFTNLNRENPSWMEDSLKRFVFGKEGEGQFAEFKAQAERVESPLEEHQLAYLNASRSWIQSYIELEETVNGKKVALPVKDYERYKSNLNNAALEKEREIKNFYLSKDFSLGNFGGIQIKPEIRLPLYAKVELAVSEEDRKKESPLRNIAKAVGGIITSLFGAIDDTGNAAMAQAAKKRNMAVFNGLNTIIKAGVTIVGGKQAGRDYAEATKKIGLGDTESSSGGKVKEDMLSVTDSPGFVAVNPEAPGQSMQTPDSIAGGMDIFSLAGPQRKIKKKSTKKKAKKQPKVTSRVSSFSDFMQSK
jgi:hypothetical protein